MKTKLIRDSVHGYIEVSEVIMENIIDTPIFQRLRQIEQTSMRTLYPSAHHDRFVHSLGVFHLGKKATDGLINNIKTLDIYLENKSFWTTYTLCFQLACLLHDCGHAPMSHSFEYGYINCEDEASCDSKRTRLLNSMIHDIEDDNTIQQAKVDVDIYFKNVRKITPHELVSAILVSEVYRNSIKIILETELEEKIDDNKIGEYIAFMMRAIIGLQYSKNEGDALGCFKNCLISLLNGNFFDVDKLDYIVRDTVESGAKNISIDIPRILNALTLVEVHNFDKETQVEDLKLNNSIYFTGCKSELHDREENNDCECTLSLSGVKLRGKFQGNLELTGSENQFTSYYESGDIETEVSGKLTRDFQKLTKIQVKVNGNGKIVGKFNGTIEIINRQEQSIDKIEGILNASLSGKIVGKIIGHIEKTEGAKVSYEIGYSKSALSVIEDTLIARNRLYLWIYAHHKVTYNDYILRNAILLSLLDGDDNNLEALEKLEKAKLKLFEKMNIDNLFFYNHASENYLLNDNDFLHNMKVSYMKKVVENKFAEEWLSRRHFFAVWKSYVEYNNFFSNLSSDQRKKLWNLLFDKNYDSIRDGSLPKEANSEEYSNTILKEFLDDLQYVWIKPAGFKLKSMDSSNLYIVLSDNSVKRFKDVISQEKITEQYVDESFFYLYTSKKLEVNQKLNLISFLKAKVKELYNKML